MYLLRRQAPIDLLKDRSSPWRRLRLFPCDRPCGSPIQRPESFFGPTQSASGADCSILIQQVWRVIQIVYGFEFTVSAPLDAVPRHQKPAPRRAVLRSVLVMPSLELSTLDPFVWPFGRFLHVAP